MRTNTKKSGNKTTEQSAIAENKWGQGDETVLWMADDFQLRETERLVWFWGGLREERWRE